MVERLVDLLFRNEERRGEADRRGSHGVGDQAGVEKLLLNRLGVRPRFELCGEQQAPSPDGDDPVECGEPVGELLAPLGGQPRNVERLHLLSVALAADGGQGLAAEGRAVVAGLKRFCDLVGRAQHAPIGHAVAERLGEGHDVGPDPVVEVVLEAEPRGRSGPDRSAPRRG